MAPCRACGASVSESARFCPSCGSPISTPCPHCGAMPSPGARFCDGCGGPLTTGSQVAEERKLATILFADITGSTALGERLDPERMRSLLRSYFDAMSAVIASWDGRLEKFIGDAIMATFGVPVAREDDAERALRAALEMLDRLESLNATFRERHGVTMQIRIGVNTGEVIAPVEPGEQLIVAGDAVNVAARLEQSAEPGTVQVGERTYLATRGRFDFSEAVPLALKGKGESVPARQVLAVATEPEPRGVPGLSAPLVGRDRELRTLLDLLDEAVETARPRMVLLKGPAGIGKSRLMQEFVREAARAHPEILTLRGRCLPAGHGITYWALGEILRSFAGISLDESADAAKHKVEAAIGDLAARAAVSGEDRVHLVHALAMTAGLSIPENPLESLQPDAVAAELARAWPRFLSAVASVSPVVVVVEDVHWAGDQLVEMIGRLLTRSSGPLLILATARPEFADVRPGFAARSEDASTVSLRPLTERQSSELIARLLESAELPADLRAEILTKAEGNPFFVEEMLRRLIDENVLVHEAGGWRTTGAASSVALPDSVHALLAARIDALPAQEKRVLQEASVIGRIFWQAPVERSAGNGAVAPALLALEQKGLIVARPTSTIAGEPEYIFKHALVRDVAYASLPKARRARAHADAAAWVEQLAGERIEEFAELVAHHYHSAVAGEDSDLAWEQDAAERERLRRRAFDALVAAGAGARRRYAVGKALELHEAALALAATDDERVQALEELGDDHFALYHCDEALDSYQQALALSGGSEVVERRVRLAEKIGLTCMRWGAFRSKPDPEAMEEILAGGLAEAYSDETRTSLLLISAHSHVYWRGSGRNDPVSVEQRLAWAKEAFAMAERIGEPLLLTRAVATLSGLYGEAGAFTDALRVSLRLLDLLDQQPSRDEQSATLSSLSSDLLTTAGDAVRAVELAERGYRLALGTSDHELMHSSGPLLRALFHIGRWPEIPAVIDAHLTAYAQESAMSCPEVQSGPPFASRFYLEVGDGERGAAATALVESLLASPQENGGRRSSAFVTMLLAEYLLAAQRPHDALALLDDLRDPDSPAVRRETAATRIQSLAALGRWDELREFVASVVSLTDGTPMLRPVIRRAEGAALAAAQDRRGAAEALRDAVAGFLRLSHPFEAARTRETLAWLVDGSERRALLEQAIGTYEALGALPHAARIRSASPTEGGT